MKGVVGGAVISGAALLLMSACAPVGRMTHDMDTMIQSATTKADHEALAKHYEQEAKALQAKAADYRRMAETYPRTGGYVARQPTLPLHWEALASKYEEAARENLELAKQHRQLAEEAPK